MMELASQAAGIALWCDQEGTILQIVRDDLGMAADLVPGRPFALGVDRASLSKALTFIVELRAKGAVFGWELNNNEQMNALRAVLKTLAGQIQTQKERDAGLYDELSRLNNEMANLQREVAKKNAELERLNALKDQFLGMAAHDLRTPLSIIMGYSDFLLDDLSDLLDPEHERFLSIIRSSSEFMLHLVDDLLDVVTIESGKLELDRQPTDLAALVERNVALNRLLAAKKQIELHLHCDAELPLLMIDGPKFEQVLNNLLSNAIKYSYPGSAVGILVSRQADHVLVSVADHGQGIPQDELDKLFRWFGRTRVKGTVGEQSTGLGLAIAHRIVLEHGGRIWVESQAGHGSTFRVSLPLGSAGRASRQRVVPEPAFDQEAILDRVHDNVGLLKELVALFSSTAPELLSGVRAALDRRDGQALARAAQALGRSASVFASGRVMDAVSRLAEMGQTDRLAGARGALAELEAEVDRLQEALEAFVTRI
jgi:signal transduction histidine kinase